MTVRDYTEQMFERFKLYYPKMKAPYVDYYRSGVDELTVLLDDGGKIFFNAMDNSIRICDADKTCDNRTEEDYRKEFARRLTRKLEMRNMYQADLARKTGISTNMINLYMHGKSTPSIYSVTKIAQALHCSPSEFLYFD